MKILVIGATGHVGAYLTETLIRRGHEVYAVARGNKKPYGATDAWNAANVVTKSRDELLSSDLIERIAPDAVCDLIAYTLDDVKRILPHLKNDAFYLLVGSIWAYENKRYVPVDENHPKNARDSYGKNKGLMEDYVLGLCAEGKLRATVVHPGHVSAKEWIPVNPQGNFDGSVYDEIAKGKEIALPYEGLPTLHHIHAQDLANLIAACVEKQEISCGEAFIAVAEKAETLRGMAESLYRHFGHEPNIRFVEWEEFASMVGKENADCSYEHISRSPCCTPEKAKRMLGVSFEYSIDDILREYADTRIAR